MTEHARMSIRKPIGSLMAGLFDLGNRVKILREMMNSAICIINMDLYKFCGCSTVSFYIRGCVVNACGWQNSKETSALTVYSKRCCIECSIIVGSNATRKYLLAL